MRGLIGHSGFVGGNLLRQTCFDALYNSRNIGDIAGRSFHLLVFSGAQSKKWWANKEPEADRAGIAKALAALDHVRAERLVLISTIDVVPERAGADESYDCHGRDNHAYGRNRLWLEDELAARFPATSIIRLPGLFGPGLQKNVIFDLLTGNLLERINPQSSFQYYDLATLWRDINTVLDARLKLVHFATAPVATAEIIARHFPRLTVGASADPAIAYDNRTRHAGLFGRDDGYIQGRDEVLDRLAAFIKGWQR